MYFSCSAGEQRRQQKNRMRRDHDEDYEHADAFPISPYSLFIIIALYTGTGVCFATTGSRLANGTGNQKKKLGVFFSLSRFCFNLRAFWVVITVLFFTRFVFSMKENLPVLLLLIFCWAHRFNMGSMIMILCMIVGSISCSIARKELPERSINH